MTASLRSVDHLDSEKTSYEAAGTLESRKNFYNPTQSQLLR
jgi:hypothetical protein